MSVYSSQMQTLGAFRPLFKELLKRPLLGNLRLVRALSSSASPYSSQSRGGLPRFFSDVLPQRKGCVLRLAGDEFWHMTKVLRMCIDDRIELFNGNGGLVEGCIQKIDGAGVDILLVEDLKVVLPPIRQWHVFAACGSLKGGRADWLVEKCTELGASSLTPLLTERSPNVSDNRVDRFKRVVLAATKQSQRLHQMSLNPPTKLNDILPIIAESKLSLVAVAEATPLVNALASSDIESNGIIIIGPEGDFTEKEVTTLREAGAVAVGLGSHRLRVETATIALLSTLMLWSESRRAMNH